MCQAPVLSASYIFTTNSDNHNPMKQLPLLSFVEKETKAQKGEITFPNHTAIRSRVRIRSWQTGCEGHAVHHYSLWPPTHQYMRGKKKTKTNVKMLRARQL